MAERESIETNRDRRNSKLEIKAMVNAGIPEDIATSWVVKGLEDLQIKGVKSIANIPWNGVK